jgi:hypothetical protein
VATKYLAWKDGQTYGVIAYDASQYARGALVCSNNGELWSAILKPYPITTAMAPELMPSYVNLVRLRSITTAEPEFRIPLEWARKTVIIPGRIYTTLAGKLTDTKVIEYTSPATRHLGSVSYTGFEKIAKRSGHSLESIHRAVNSAVVRAIEVWSWQCTGLEVKFHESGRAFGLAYEPGKGARKISLNALLLQTYDLNSIARVVIHELCHHYREETWPRSYISDVHDKRFCEELTKADPEIAGSEGSRSTAANRCITFADIPDTALKAAVEERKAARIIEPTWAPEAGILNFYILKSGHLRMSWEPRSGFRWTQWIRSVSDSHVLELLKHFGPSDWNRVVVKTTIVKIPQTEFPSTQFGQPPIRGISFHDLVHWILAKYARISPKTKAYVEEIEATK